jgi:hypothetical protein
MGLHVVGNLLVSDADHVNNRAEVDKELRTGLGVTELCVRNNRAAQTAKRVIVHMTSRDGRPFSFNDWYLAPGESLGTSLLQLNIQVVSFEIRWQVPSTGSPMWATTGLIKAPGDEYFPAFGIRWDEHDQYAVIYPD